MGDASSSQLGPWLDRLRAAGAIVKANNKVHRNMSRSLRQWGRRVVTRA